MRRDARRSALVAATVLVPVLAALALLSLALDATPFWRDHFGDAHSRTGIVLWAVPFLAGMYARAWRPLGWESELASRALKNLAHAVALWWFFGALLDAARLAALTMVPFLLAAPFAALLVARQGALGAGPRRTIILAAAAAAAAAVAVVVVAWHDPVPGMLAVAALLAVPRVTAPPLGVHLARRAAAGDGSRRPGDPALPAAVFDLPPGTLRPPGGHLTALIAVTAVLLVLFVVAPGVPLGAVVAWAAVVIALPVVTQALVARHGVAHARAVIAPAYMRRHESRVTVIPDENLQLLDDAVERFLAWGSGRDRLARAMAKVLQPPDPEATAHVIRGRLDRVARWPWRRRQREDALVGILREGFGQEGAT